MYFQYGIKETEYLKGRDPLLDRAVDKIGHIYREVDDDIFSSVIRHIIGQQISTPAQETIWKRLRDKIGAVNVDNIYTLQEDELQRLGITFRKAGYIRGFAKMVKDGELSIESLRGMSDNEVIKELTTVKGIGPWTAEMVLTFSLQRPDVVSHGDLAIRRGMMMLYGLEDISREEFRKYKRLYSPYGTVASLYLWAIAGGALQGAADGPVD
ncbi:MAG: DNA-3-methyladenine glycosylase 2 family protein [Clostridia bacterium]|nr:DNA-3-methyladenine glycosylase 2 family protein [Clostridia bacterium]